MGVTLSTTPSERGDAGFAMVALLVGMAVAAIWMTAALPAWRQQAMRQKEDDLIFRGEQYARAIVLYQQKNRGAYPPSIDVLVSGHYLRKKWKDPITNEDFVPLGIGVSLPGASQPAGGAPGQGRGGQPGTPQQQGQAPGITGVRSSSTATSIKIYEQQQQYSMWPFDARLAQLKMVRQQPPGANQPGRQGGAGDRGGPQQPGRGGVPGRGGAPAGPGTVPGRGGIDRPGPAGPPAGRAGGS